MCMRLAILRGFLNPATRSGLVPSTAAQLYHHHPRSFLSALRTRPVHQLLMHMRCCANATTIAKAASCATRATATNTLHRAPYDAPLGRHPGTSFTRAARGGAPGQLQVARPPPRPTATTARGT
jgi:hypothetical protein